MVLQGSGAWEAGLRPGQRLAALSDPNRFGQVWALNGTSSFRFVRQSVRMHMGPTIIVEVEDSNLLEEEKNELVSVVDGPVPVEQSGDKRSATSSALSSMDVLDSMLSSSDDGSVARSQTVAEQLEQKYQCAPTLQSIMHQ
jgi:hypothetical protein